MRREIMISKKKITQKSHMLRNKKSWAFFIVGMRLMRVHHGRLTLVRPAMRSTWFRIVSLLNFNACNGPHFLSVWETLLALESFTKALYQLKSHTSSNSCCKEDKKCLWVPVYFPSYLNWAAMRYFCWAVNYKRSLLSI